jgi:hypothetical protein
MFSHVALRSSLLYIALSDSLYTVKHIPPRVMKNPLLVHQSEIHNIVMKNPLLVHQSEIHNIVMKNPLLVHQSEIHNISTAFFFNAPSHTSKKCHIS